MKSDTSNVETNISNLTEVHLNYIYIDTKKEELWHSGLLKRSSDDNFI